MADAKYVTYPVCNVVALIDTGTHNGYDTGNTFGAGLSFTLENLQQ
jgi:hypothetical protein